MSSLTSIVYSFLHSPLVLLGLCSLLPWSTKAVASTLENMQAAYDRESNSHARYLAFAERADAEGYGAAASLFRAAARAEDIHATGIANLILELGVVPQGHVEVPEVGTTRENLSASIKIESCERDIVYKEYVRQAKLDRNKSATANLDRLITAETEQANLFIDAMLALDCLKGLREATYFVCPECGFITREATLSHCPTCLTPREGFEVVV